MSKVVFLDVDGTLINYQAQLPQSAKEAVNKARENGHIIIICTGCSKAEINERGLMPVDGMILGNGAYAEIHGHKLFHQSLTKEECKHIVDWCQNRNLGLYLECNLGMFCDENFVKQAPKTMVEYAFGKGAPKEEAEKIASGFVGSMQAEKDLYRDDVNKISFILSSYQDHLDSKEEFKGLKVNTWGGKGEHALFGDVGPSNITKQYAINEVLKYLNKSKNDAIAFGDAKIDLSMFEACGYGVAMGNGGREIKEAADYITDDVDNDGLAKAFAYLKLI